LNGFLHLKKKNMIGYRREQVRKVQVVEAWKSGEMEREEAPTK
jgi:hypothetical protein